MLLTYISPKANPNKGIFFGHAKYLISLVEQNPYIDYKLSSLPAVYPSLEYLGQTYSKFYTVVIYARYHVYIPYTKLPSTSELIVVSPGLSKTLIDFEQRKKIKGISIQLDYYYFREQNTKGLFALGIVNNDINSYGYLLLAQDTVIPYIKDLLAVKQNFNRARRVLTLRDILYASSVYLNRYILASMV